MYGAKTGKYFGSLWGTVLCITRLSSNFWGAPSFAISKFRGEVPFGLCHHLRHHPVVAEVPQHALPFSLFFVKVFSVTDYDFAETQGSMDEDDKRKIDDRTENSQHKVLNPVDRRYSRTPDSSNLSTRRLRSKSIGAHEPSNFLDEHRRAGFRQPATSQSVYPGFVANQQGDERNEINYPSTMVYAPASQAHARRPRSHSRSGSEQFAPRVDSSAPPVPSLPLGPILQSHLPPMPSVVPYGWPVGTIWVRDVNGRPRLQTPEQYQAQHDTHSSASPQAERHPPRRSRSHSRSRLEQPQPHLDSSVAPVPAAPLVPESKRKKLPMPSVIPPGWPDGTRWVRDRNGRPYLETPEQYRVRYNIQTPAVPFPGQEHQEHVSFQPLPLPHAVPQPQPTSVQRPYPAITQPPTIVSPFPQKPFLKRLFGGIVGGSKTPKTHGAVQLPPVNPSTPSQPLLRTKRRPRTKSF